LLLSSYFNPGVVAMAIYPHFKLDVLIFQAIISACEKKRTALYWFMEFFADNG